MYKFLIPVLAALFVTSPASAQVYYYPGTPYYAAPVYAAPIYAPPVYAPPVVQVVPVAPPVVQYVPAPTCITYPDPWDTLGYIFGDPIMIQVCR